MAIKLGFAPTRRSIFSAPDAIKYRGLTAQKLKELGIDFVDIDDINEEGLLYDENDRIRILEKFKAEKVDGLFLPHCNFGTEFLCARLAKDLGVEESVVFTGMMAAERIPQILKNATILALDRPDNIQAKYGFPTKLGEYLLTGNPTVLTRVGDLPLFLKDGESALFAQPDNPEDFAAKMNWCLEHPAEAQDIGTKGREVAQQYFSYATETQKMVEVMLNNQKA